MKRFFGTILISAAIALGVILPTVSFAQEGTEPQPATIENQEGVSVEQDGFRANVFKVIKERVEGDRYYQDLQLTGKTGNYKGKTIYIYGARDNITSKYLFEEGDVVYVTVTKAGGQDNYLVTDKSRLPALYAIFAIFVGMVLLVGRKHGARALLSLVMTFIVIVGFIVPRILAGSDPVLTVVISSLVIVILSMLIVYGWNRKSRVAISGMLIGILITAVIAYLFSKYASLTGSSVEEAMFIRDYLGTKIDFRGLLLASFILGFLGVLDDIAITQVSTTQEIVKTDSTLSQEELYKKVMKVGVDHISSMINTLFLAYAGASFVLLLLFGLNQPPFNSFNDVINNEFVATEIIRTLVGSIGLVLTVPVTTLIASYIYASKEHKKSTRNQDGGA